MSTNATAMKLQAPALVPEIWSLTLNKKLDKSGVGMKIVNKHYEKDIKNFGDTVTINELGDVNIGDYDDVNGMGAAQRVSSTSQQLVLDQQKYFNIELGDIQQKESNIKGLMDKFVARAKIAVDLHKDTHILSSFADIPSDNLLDPVTLTKDNAYEVFVNLAEVLKENNAIQVEIDEIDKSNQVEGSMPWVVINPKVESILLKCPEFIHATQKGDMVLRKGSIGSIAGLDILMCTNLPTVSTGSGETLKKTVNIMAGINDAIAYAGNISKLEFYRPDNKFSDNAKGLYVYGKKTIRPEALSGVVATV